MKLPSITTVSSIILGSILAVVATFSFVIDIVTSINDKEIRFIPLSLDIIFMVLAYSTAWQGIYHIMYQKFTRQKMEMEWDYKVKPVIELMQDTVGKINKLEEDVLSTNLQTASTLEYFMSSQELDASKAFIYPGTSFKLISKIMMLIVVTSASLVYVSEYPLGIIHYFILLLYLLWWLLFTSEYKLFSKTSAWVWAVAPILIIPSMGIILDVTLGLNNMIALLFASMLIYAYSYYWWSCYVSTGFNIMSLRPIIKFFIKGDDSKD
ncbi:MAG: hypothetical protein P1P72_05275 [ANME-2 cluster archaeon]|nr:hypothetical protein [ANME-2 cluster archaeon]